MNTQREARRDAEEYARAQMYYGEGAGTRRKLIMATVESKSAHDPAYGRAFHAELSRQDMAEHAAKARKERHRTDRHESVKRNTRAMLTGNTKNAETGVLIILAVAYVAHQTGYDKKAWEKVLDAKSWASYKWRVHKNKRENAKRQAKLKSVN